MPLTKDSREFVECLLSNRVEFLIVGALAVSWHGFPRYSGDIDFFVNPNQENATRVLNALRQFGFGGLGISLSDLNREGTVIQLGIEPNRIVSGTVDGIDVPFIGRDALIRNKKASGRSKDLIDVTELTRKESDPS